eukprot:TRINITY_DN25243_c0_g1_i2.p1 TRINITY_DN25243_c0_g1~~TRINITY_DN25243_c0_g1_i2.p1  ORF type:complete len:185 (-),score=33.16 TRINITY_DN25243_c0_g1_i2:165-719(-)
MISVLVERLDGSYYEFEPQQGSSVLDVKIQLESVWDIPLFAMRLFRGEVEMADDRRIRGYLEDDGDGALRLCVTLVVDTPALLNDIKERMKSPNSASRSSALTEFSQLVSRGDDEAIRAVGTCAGDKDFLVRYAAVEALGRLAVPGDVRVIKAVTPCLKDPDPAVRRVAEKTLNGLKTSDESVP